MSSTLIRYRTPTDIAVEAEDQPYRRFNAERRATVAAVGPRPLAAVGPSCPAWRIWLSCLVTAVLLALFFPVMSVAYLLVRLTSQGPGIYRQTRLGLNGEPFELYKLRTMRIDAESASGAVWAEQNDPRTTAVGRWLRRTHIDELPQLVNVFKGEMALVGPRPERPGISDRMCDEIPGFERRLAVRPGITGLAQINIPYDTVLDFARRKLVLDLDYISQTSIWLDGRIILATLPRFFGIKGKLINRLVGVYRYVPPSKEARPESPLAAEASANGHSKRGVRENDASADCFQETSRGNGQRNGSPRTGFHQAFDQAVAQIAAANRALSDVSIAAQSNAPTPETTLTFLESFTRVRETLNRTELLVLEELTQMTSCLSCATDAQRADAS